MNATRLLAVVFIFLVASGAWLVLGRTLTQRTETSRTRLGKDVERMFGPQLAQDAPTLRSAAAEGGGRPPDASDVVVDVEHEDRNRGLVWFSVYRLLFEATYTFQPPADAGPGSPAVFGMDLPSDAILDAISLTVDGRAHEVTSNRIEVPVPFDAGRPSVVRVAYATAGQDAWEYRPRSGGGGLRDFNLVVRTDFDEIDYPVTGLSPTERASPRDDGRPGRQAAWRYAQMLPARNNVIGVVMPAMPAAGTVSARLATFAPVSLLFFLAVMIVIQVLKGWRLHPMNYLLVAAGFFAFHILLAYLVDHVPLRLAFWVAAAVSVILVVTYLRLVLGAKAAIFVAGAAQLVYLVGFGYAFFWEGWTGLTIVVGAVLTLAVLMQMTGRIDWDVTFRQGAGNPARKRSARLDPEAGPEPAATGA